MLVNYGEGQQRSGRLGATIASHNRYGSYYRAGTIPVNPQTDRQVVVRNAVTNLMVGWQNTLTQAQRDGWDLYASNIPWFNAVGQATYLTGNAMFVRSNVPRIQAGMAQVDAPPTIMNLAAAEASLACTASEATQQASVTFDNTQAWATEDGAAEIFYGGKPVNGSIKFFGGPYRLIGPALGDSGGAPASPALLNWPWPFAEGNRLWIRSRITRADGRLSKFAQVNFLAAA